MQTLYFLVLVFVFVFGLVVSARKRFAMYQVDEPMSWGCIFTIPKRFFFDVHHVVSREQTSSWMHVFIAGGFIGILLSMFLSLFFSVFTWFIWVGLLAMSGGVVLWHQRRKGAQKTKRSNGDFLELPYIFVVFIGALAMMLQFDSFLFTLIAFLVALTCVYLISFSGALDKPLKHIVSGALNLAFHPRAKRFTQLDSTLKPLDLSNVNHLGIRSAEDFTWQQRLNFDACIECGRCQSMCPAFDAGQPLNPKKLIQDLLHSMNGKSDVAYAGVGHPGVSGKRVGVGVQDQAIVGGMIDAETIWSCTTCRACVYECPMMVEHVDAIIGLRAHQTMSVGALPEKSSEVLDALRYNKSVSGKSIDTRNHWAIDLDVPFVRANEKVGVLLWIGEAGFELNNQKTLRQLVHLIKKTNTSIALIEAEQDSGDLARRLGDEALFQKLAKSNIAQLQQYQFDTLLTIDPHALHVIKNEYPAFGGQFNVMHHSEWLQQILSNKQITITEDLANMSVAYHDPCYLGRYNDIIKEPRSVMHTLGVSITQMDRSGKRSRCCGWGGGSAFSDISGEKRIADMRMADVVESGASTVVVACPNCKTMLESVVQPRPEVIDLVELVYKATGGQK